MWSHMKENKMKGYTKNTINDITYNKIYTSDLDINMQRVYNMK